MPPPRSSDTPLLGLPRQPLTPQQQLDAIRRMQNQAEQRVKLGMQLFKAVEARVAEQRDLLSAIKQHEQQVHDSVQSDVAKSLQQYDQWIGKIDENFTKAMRQLEQRFVHLERTVNEQQSQVQSMLHRAEQMLGQARHKLHAPPPPPDVVDAAETVELPKPKAPVEPRRPRLADSSSDPDDSGFDEKIYSQLLRRLRQNPPPDSSPDDPKDDRTDRAA